MRGLDTRRKKLLLAMLAMNLSLIMLVFPGSVVEDLLLFPGKEISAWSGC